MSQGKIWGTLIILILIFGGLILIGRFGNVKIASDWGLFRYPLNFVFGGINYFSNFLSEIGDWRNLAQSNIELKEKNMKLLAETAEIQIIKDENAKLRQALNLGQRLDKQFISANIFSSAMAPNGLDFIINKGAEAGLKKDLVVITESGVLIGVVKEVFAHSAKLTSVLDEKFKITARDINSGATGIATGALRDGLNLSLVVQADEISEGDIIVSSGDDFFPAGLIIGQVSFVESKEGELFKKVRIKPAFEDVLFSSVLIIK
jgi:rod shape-determining protein MreC